MRCASGSAVSRADVMPAIFCVGTKIVCMLSSPTSLQGQANFDGSQASPCRRAMKAQRRQAQLDEPERDDLSPALLGAAAQSAKATREASRQPQPAAIPPSTVKITPEV